MFVIWLNDRRARLWLAHQVIKHQERRGSVEDVSRRNTKIWKEKQSDSVFLSVSISTAASPGKQCQSYSLHNMLETLYLHRVISSHQLPGQGSEMSPQRPFISTQAPLFHYPSPWTGAPLDPSGFFACFFSLFHAYSMRRSDSLCSERVTEYINHSFIFQILGNYDETGKQGGHSLQPSRISW